MQRPVKGQKLQTHLRVVRALVAREITTRFGKKPGGYIWTLFEPVVFVLILSAAFAALSRTAPIGETRVEFFLTGYSSFVLFRSVSNFASGGINFNRSLLGFPSVTPYDAILSRLYLEFFALMTGVILMHVVIYGWLAKWPEIDPAYVMLSILCAMGLASGIAFSNAVLFWRYPIWEQVYGLVTRPLVIISGVIYLPDERLPPAVLDVLSFNPLMHIIAWMRMGFYPTYDPSFVSLAYLGWWILITNAAGLALIRFHQYNVVER